MDLVHVGRTEAKIKLFRNMAMSHIKFKGKTHTTTWEQICAAIFKSFIKIHLIILFELAGLNFMRFMDNLNSVLAKNSFMQSVGLKA